MQCARFVLLLAALAAANLCLAQLSGSYDVGGGAMHYATPLAAVTDLQAQGMGGDVVLNVYTGTYVAQLNLQPIANLGTYNLTIQRAAPGEVPVINGGTYAFYIYGASKNITIAGIRTTAFSTHAYYLRRHTTLGYPDNITIRDCYISGSATTCIRAEYPMNLLVERNEIVATGAGTRGLWINLDRGGCIYRNNMVRCANGDGALQQTGNGALWLNNSFLQNGNNACFAFSTTFGTWTMKNNIFVVTSSTGFCLRNASTMATVCPTFSDYNDFWAPLGCVYGRWNVEYSVCLYTTFALYRAGCPNNDINSLNCDPGYLSATDLHIAVGSCVDNRGTPLPEVTDDFDRAPRSATTPDIGADEVGPCPLLVHLYDHFCLHFTPGQEIVVYWCCPWDGPPVFSWRPGCEYGIPGCMEICPEWLGPVFWTAQYDSSNANCPLPGGWWSARFWAEGEGCVCVSFDDQLGVELTTFAAVAGDGQVELRWSTASETDNDHFNVYRATEGSDRRLVGTVAGHGTAAIAHHYTFVDRSVNNGVNYEYRLAAVDINGAIEWVGDVVTATPGAASSTMPTEYALYQNYPNPFNPVTQIVFDLPASGPVKLVVVNAVGQQVTTLTEGACEAGRHEVTFDGAALPSGLYFYTLTVNNFTATKKMLLLK